MATTVSAQSARVALERARRQLDELNLGETGQRHRTIADGLYKALDYIERTEAIVGKLLDTATLRDGIAIQRALDAAGVGGTIRQVAPAADDQQDPQPARYRVDLDGWPTVEGTVEELTRLLALVRG